MTDIKSIPISPLFHVGATFVLVGMAFAMSLNIIASLQGEMSSVYAVHLIALHLPSLCYLGAVWCARNAFKHFSSGNLLDETLPRMLRQIGILCTIGSVFHLFGQAAILNIIDRGVSYLTFDAGAIALMSIGVILIMLARLCEQAIVMKQHLSEIV